MPSTRLKINLRRESESPLYRQISEQIRAQIDSGELPAGARLPASRSLARQLGLSRISIVNAYADLRAAGYVSAQAGRGTYVARDREPAGGQQPQATAPATSQRSASYRQMMRLASRPGVIDFSGGTPPSEFFPVRYLQDAINHVIERDGADALSYEAPEGSPAQRGARLCARHRHRLPRRRCADHRRRPASH